MLKKISILLLVVSLVLSLFSIVLAKDPRCTAIVDCDGSSGLCHCEKNGPTACTCQSKHVVEIMGILFCSIQGDCWDESPYATCYDSPAWCQTIGLNCQCNTNYW